MPLINVITCTSGDDRGAFTGAQCHTEGVGGAVTERGALTCFARATPLNNLPFKHLRTTTSPNPSMEPPAPTPAAVESPLIAVVLSVPLAGASTLNAASCSRRTPPCTGAERRL